MKVLITGGAGFLGRGILRRVANGDLSWDVTVYSRDEAKQDLCKRRYPFARYLLGDVRDVDRLTAVAAGHELIVHAAALKYIPEAEMNPWECVAVNVDGSRNVMRAARATGVRQVIGISTDKSCQPVNAYGASKMLLERMFAETVQGQAGTQFNCVRYGNVVGSTGSVIPLFKRQYVEVGHVRVTNLNMSRFWISIDEAIDLILAAQCCCVPGSIAVPMARAMTMPDVARAATKDDVEIEVIGERPGEKLHELLIHYEESVRVQLRELSILGRDIAIWELLPPGQLIGEAPFTLASHTPNLRMSPAEMRELIADAELV